MAKKICLDVYTCDTAGLNVADIVNVSVSLAPVAAQAKNFGSMLIVGDSDIIDTAQRFRLYTSLSGLTADGFGSSAPEYLAAQVFFSQSPGPAQLYVGRWAASATHGRLNGGPLTSAQQAIGNFTPITNGGVNFTVDGTARNLTGLNFTSAANMNGVASVIQAGFAGAATCIWDASNNRFVIKSSSTGTNSSVSFGSTGAGTDISSLIRVQSTQGGNLVQGIGAETIESCVSTMVALTNVWYGLSIAATAAVLAADHVAIAGIIEADGTNSASGGSVYAVTTQDPNSYNASSNTDLAALLQAGGYSRTFCQYSSTSPYAAVSAFARAFTVNFNASNTTLTLKFKQEPSVIPETLTEAQAQALTAKNCNVYVNYNNSTAILQQGTMANGFFFDEIHGADWFANQVQTDLYNALYSNPTKIPQTDAGINQLATILTQDCQMAVNNGYVAPGVWTGPPVGALQTGQTLTTGYYVFQPPISSQSVAARQARQSPVLQVALKLAGAVHSVAAIVSINR